MANSGDPDQMPHDAASDQVLHCLPTGIFIQNEIEMKDRNERNIPYTLKLEMNYSN